MTTIYFVRHGEYENPEKIVPWRLPDFPLSKEGEKDMTRDGEYFKNKNIEVIYSSPILRTRQSAKILSDILNVKAEISPNIDEIYTPMQNQKITYEELFKKRTIPYKEEFHIKNRGENFEDIFKRVNKLVKTLLKKYQDKNIILVSHGDPIMIYFYKMLGKTFDFEDLLDGEDYIQKAGIIKFTFNSEKFVNTERVNL